jgi:hypothetical protein
MGYTPVHAGVNQVTSPARWLMGGEADLEVGRSRCTTGKRGRAIEVTAGELE